MNFISKTLLFLYVISETLSQVWDISFQTSHLKKENKEINWYESNNRTQAVYMQSKKNADYTSTSLTKKKLNTHTQINKGIIDSKKLMFNS